MTQGLRRGNIPEREGVSEAKIAFVDIPVNSGVQLS